MVCRDCAPTGAARVHPETAALLDSLMAGEWDRVDVASPGSGSAASGLIAAYAQWHLERGIRSLSHVAADPGGDR
jgi:DNA repair protein RecO (recombination protein O)